MTLEKPVPPLGNTVVLDRQLPTATAQQWLQQGWQDFKASNMEASLLYGVAVFMLSILVVAMLYLLHLDFVLFPALAGFLLVGPALALGLYEKSRRLEQGSDAGILEMLRARPRARGHVAFVALILMLWIGLWLRAGVLLYAMFFGIHEFPGLGGILTQLLLQPTGWALLLSGSLLGALFATFAFAISVVSVPMLLHEETDAFTAMGASIALVWHNLPVMLTWGAIVLGLFIATLVTALVGLIIVFPVLGHATWHVYRDLRGDTDAPVFQPALSELAS